MKQRTEINSMDVTRMADFYDLAVSSKVATRIDFDEKKIDGRTMTDGRLEKGKERVSPSYRLWRCSRVRHSMF